MFGRSRTTAIVDGLEAAGADPTRASFINAILGIRSIDGAALCGTHSVGFAMDQEGKVLSADNGLRYSVPQLGL
jgi:hypothetical protein